MYIELFYLGIIRYYHNNHNSSVRVPFHPPLLGPSTLQYRSRDRNLTLFNSLYLHSLGWASYLIFITLLSSFSPSCACLILGLTFGIPSTHVVQSISLDSPLFLPLLSSPPTRGRTSTHFHTPPHPLRCDSPRSILTRKRKKKGKAKFDFHAVIFLGLAFLLLTTWIRCCSCFHLSSSPSKLSHSSAQGNVPGLQTITTSLVYTCVYTFEDRRYFETLNTSNRRKKTETFLLARSHRSLRHPISFCSSKDLGSPSLVCDGIASPSLPPPGDPFFPLLLSLKQWNALPGEHRLHENRSHPVEFIRPDPGLY